ncbi:hypothetical protein OKW41_006004 [Paraburkholderia sp. UCT70]|uniref:hypothetical protein n=1 Tax=Paraburkholderia sp. UCT70 TaxID=2991068 RepID=UPI003D20A703
MAGIPAIVTPGSKMADVLAGGTRSVGIGHAAHAAGDSSVSAGVNSAAESDGSVAIGNGAQAPDAPWAGGVAVGANAVSALGGVAIGNGSVAGRGVAIMGTHTDHATSGLLSVAMMGTTTGAYAVAICGNADGAATAIGGGSSSGAIGLAAGRNAVAANWAVAVGPYCNSRVAHSTAMGFNSVCGADAEGAVAIGAYSAVSRADTISFGRTQADSALLGVSVTPAMKNRQLACVAAGAYMHDAINGEQFNKLATAINQLGAGVSGFTPIPLLPFEP